MEFAIMGYEEITDDGIFDVVEKKHGIKIKTLKTPSKAYLETQLAEKAKNAAIQELNKKKLTKERIIKDRLRTIAVQSLKDSGDWLNEWDDTDVNGET